MRSIYVEMQTFTLAMAGDEAVTIIERLEVLDGKFQAARALNDENCMKAVATERRGYWRQLSPLLKAARTQYKVEIKERFLNRIGNTTWIDK